MALYQQWFQPTSHISIDGLRRQAFAKRGAQRLAQNNYCEMALPATYQIATKEAEGPFGSDADSHVPLFSRRQDVAIVVHNLVGKGRAVCGCGRSQATRQAAPPAAPAVAHRDVGLALLANGWERPPTCTS